MNKRTVIIIGVILGIVALGIGIYFAWQNRKQIAQVIPVITGGVISPTQKEESRLRILSSREVENYWVLKNVTPSDIFYVDADKNILKIDKDNIETTDVINLKGMVSTIPNASGSSIFARMSLSGDATVYDIANNKWKQEMIGVDTAVWGVEGDRIARLVTSDDTGAKTPRVEVGTVNDEKPFANVISSESLRGFDLQWPQKDSLYLVQNPSAEYISDMWKLDLKTKKLSKFLSANGLIVDWAKFGSVGLMFSTTPDRQHRLALIDSEGRVVRNFSFVTLPEKCDITSPTQMYCAISRDQDAFANMTLPDDYLKRAVYFKDGIYQIDIEKNTIRAIFEDEEPIIDATNLTVLDDRILFINRYDRKLYSLNLQ